MAQVARAPARRRTVVVAAFMAVVSLLALVFHGGLSSNPGSRVLTVLAIVEDGTLRADRFRDLTIDRALVGHHFYSDKAPLSSFVVLPFFFLWRAIAPHPLTDADIALAVQIGNVVAAAIPFAAFTALLWRRASAGRSNRDAAWIALLAAFGTFVFPYAGMYLGHVLSGALLVFAYDEATHASTPHAFRAGVLAGFAVLAEYPVLIPVGILGVWMASRGTKQAVRYAAGGAPAALAVCAYNNAITGSPFDPAYRHVAAQFHAPWGRAFGLDAQAVHAAWMLLVSEYRGLVFYAPALLVLVPLALARARSHDRALLLAALTLAQFGFVASFFMWDGGWAIGPRHLVPLAMLLSYEGVCALARTPGARLSFVALASVGLSINLVATATNPFVEGFDHPFRDLYWPAFARGELVRDNLFAAVDWHPGRIGVLLWVVLFLAAGLVFTRVTPTRAP